jgi:hypothetical protein
VSARLVRAVAVVAASVALLAWPAAFAVDRLLGLDAVVVRPFPPAEVDRHRAAFAARAAGAEDEDVARLYGESFGRFRVVVRDDGRVLHPPEKPSLAIYRAEDGVPLQARTVFFAARFAAVGGAVLALVAFLATRRRPAGGRASP